MGRGTHMSLFFVIMRGEICYNELCVCVCVCVCMCACAALKCSVYACNS